MLFAGLHIDIEKTVHEGYDITQYLEDKLDTLILKKELLDDMKILADMGNILDNLILVKNNIIEFGVTPSLEMMVGNSNIELTVESIGDKIRGGLNKIIEFIKKMINKIKSWFKKSNKKVESKIKIADNKLNSGLKKYNDNDTITVKSHTYPSAYKENRNDALSLITNIIDIITDNNISIDKFLSNNYFNIIVNSTTHKVVFEAQPKVTATIGTVEIPVTELKQHINNLTQAKMFYDEYYQNTMILAEDILRKNIPNAIGDTNKIKQLLFITDVITDMLPFYQSLYMEILDDDLYIAENLQTGART